MPETIEECHDLIQHLFSVIEKMQERIDELEAKLNENSSNSNRPPSSSRSVLASLSPAGDKATNDLMKIFYTNLLKSDKAKSLANAQREMLSGKINPKFKHPKYWANFVLIGTDR